jgi:hypothetical protein
VEVGDVDVDVDAAAGDAAFCLGESWWILRVCVGFFEGGGVVVERNAR